MAGAATVKAPPAAAALLVAALVFLAVLAVPDRPGAPLAGLTSLPLELPLILLGLFLVRAGSGAALVLRGVIVGWLLLALVLRIGDFGMRAAFNRPFNPLLDLPLLGSGWDLASGAVGPVLAGVAVGVIGLMIAAVARALWWATGQWVRLDPGPWRRLAGTALLGTAVLVAADAGRAARLFALPVDPPGQAMVARLIPERASLLRQSLSDLADFRAASETDRFATATGLLDRLAGRETIIAFVESYGRTSFDAPLYSTTHVPTLRRAEPALRAAGFEMRSGWLTSPIQGGQSWLAHGTLAAGLRLDNQTRYGAMLASPRRTLYEIAGDEGFRTVAVMPAITLAWPEGRMLGFSEIFAAADLGYRGLPYNWVTMPDQFTLTALDRIRAAATDGSSLVQVALISSHAPWTPVPDLVDWDSVGDGTILNEWAGAGDPPEVVWRDRDRVRDQYRQSIDYALRAVMGHAALQRGTLPLIVVLGDHQPAPFVALGDSRDVPVHVIGPSDLVALTDGWGWTAGLVPDPALPAWPMEAFRDRFLETFTSSVPPA